MAYGYNVEPYKPDKLVDLIEKMMTKFSLAAAPMAWAVDIVSALQYLPESFPGQVHASFISVCSDLYLLSNPSVETG